MAVQSVSVDVFLELANDNPVLDVRSSGEYVHAHIPGAHSVPLFSDDERKQIGTAYKQDSREAAIKIGLDAFGPKMRGMVEAVERLLQDGKHLSGDGQHTVLVHCWRGGMRSSAVAWLLDFYGFNVYLLEGGYKSYRQWVIGHWEDSGPYRILCGNTGSGKTRVLHELEQLGEPVLDLEGLAAHKGSAFGGLDSSGQPTQEMFENRLALGIDALRKRFGSRAIWVEDESQRIGDVNIPTPFFQSLKDEKRVFLNVPFEERLDNIVAEYGKLKTEGLINSIVRIKKRLGPLETKTAISHLVEGDVRECFRILLQYYDKHYYPKGQADIYSFDGSGRSETEIAELIKTTIHE